MGIGLGELFVLLVLGLLLGLTGLWIWMIIDCATNEVGPGDDRLIWILVVVLTDWIGALVYLTVRRPKRRALLGR
jgi:hypothetical protein